MLTPVVIWLRRDTKGKAKTTNGVRRVVARSRRDNNVAPEETQHPVNEDVPRQSIATSVAAAAARLHVYTRRG